MDMSLLVKQLKIYEDEFIRFTDIEKFPAYEVQAGEISEAFLSSHGFETAASATYDSQNQKHILLIRTNIPLNKYTIFHEFTHIIDAEEYKEADIKHQMGLSGYMEYHASQIQLVKMLGAIRVKEVPSFSMNTIIIARDGEKSVSQFISEKQHHAIELFSRSDFLDDTVIFNAAMGALYNYFGFRSICEKYSTDYTENISNAAFLKYIPTSLFVNTNRLMHGWLNEEQIESSIIQYFNIIYPLIMEIKEKRLKRVEEI